ncbi:MaoC family dehydratase N-terminal domain-containing protein [Oceanobacillus saliphilus]|uniref:MaoC family dehydratase N-terminal domain-containing protein n=1 Tax=Oceanobacillus saliphilus TaxID=2925834 RepID=UPI00201D64E3|nr:MaoC family dehydratase N-terminal domain-containing protein [Oceanobacillus saliphilus]
MIERSIIGVESKPVTYEIEKGAIKKFAKAIGEDNPIYFNEDVAIEKGYPSLLAPITFPTTFREDVPDWFSKLDKNKLLHGEQSYTYHKRLFAGDKVDVTEAVTDVYEKSGSNGLLTFIIRVRKGYKEEALLFTEQSTFIIRGGK